MYTGKVYYARNVHPDKCTPEDSTDDKTENSVNDRTENMPDDREGQMTGHSIG